MKIGWVQHRVDDMSMFKKHKLTGYNSPLSRFVNEASSEEKRKIYDKVLKLATEQQNAVLAECRKKMQASA